MRHIGLNLTIVACLVAIVAVADRPDISQLIIIGVLCAWILPGIWRLGEGGVRL